MRRRDFLVRSGPAVLALGAGSVVAVTATAEGLDSRALDKALVRLQQLPSETSYLIEIDKPRSQRFRAAFRPKRRMFVGSAVKTFILAKYLQDVEAGLLSEDAKLAIDNGVRSLQSPVLLDVTGAMPARSYSRP